MYSCSASRIDFLFLWSLVCFHADQRRLVKCFGPGIEFKIHQGQEQTLIKKKKKTQPFGPFGTGGPLYGSKSPGVSLPALRDIKMLFQGTGLVAGSMATPCCAGAPSLPS